MKRNCLICKRERDENVMTVFKVSESEIETLKRISGVNPESTYALCKPCLGVMGKKDTAIQYIRGDWVIALRASGVPTQQAEAAVDAFCKKLAAATPKTNPS